MRLVFRLRHASSLKEKRQASAALRERVRSRFNAAVGEVEAPDDLHRLVIGVVVVGSDGGQVRTSLDHIVEQMEGWHLAELVEREVDVGPFEGRSPWLTG